MRNSKLLRGLIVVGFLVTTASALAQNQVIASSSPSSSSVTPSQAYVNAWRASAKKNFFEGFCVGQTLAAQQIMVQPSQQVDQTTANAFKAAIVSCKSQIKNVGNSSPSPSTGL